MKRFASAALALALAATLTPAAFAAGETPALDTTPLNPGAQAAYNAKILVNGTDIKAESIPAASSDLPLRAVAEADYGFANWYAEENLSMFNLDANSVSVDTATGAIKLNDAAVDGMTATFVNGVTFVPMGLINHMEGYKLSVNDAEGAGTVIDITTPNGAPLTKLAREIIADTEMASSMKNSAEDLTGYLKIDASHYTEFAGFSSMNVRADTIFIGKLAQGADKKAVLAELEARRAAVQQSFEQYLPGPLEMAKAGKVVESGEYVMLIISPDVEKAVELFNAGVKAL